MFYSYIFVFGLTGVILGCGATQDDLSSLRNKLEQQAQIIQRQDEALADVMRKLEVMDAKKRSQEEIVASLQQSVEHRDQRLKNMERAKVEKGKRGPLDLIERIDDYFASGCLSDYIGLFCPNGRRISVYNATYGQYSQECTAECCNPRPEDCVEMVESNNPSDWLSLQLQCNNETSCAYRYTGAIIDACANGYLADYMQIFFNCLPDDGTEPNQEVVAFSVWTQSNRFYSSANATVLFPDTITNIGDHYDTSTGQFTCPLDGVYLFSINFNTDVSQQVDLELVRNEQVLVRAWADPIQSLENHASAFTITECYARDVIRPRTRVASCDMSGTPVSHFSGYMLTQI